MFPLRDDNPTLGTSAVTFLLVVVNVVSWVFVQGMGTEPALSHSVCTLGMIPGELLGTVPPGTAVPIAQGVHCVVTAEPNWLTVVTSMFMHGGWFHLIGNLWFLVVFGDNVEDAMGSLRFVAFYLVCGLAAVLAQTLSNPASAIPMVGASGAIGGVMGAYALLYPRAPVHMLLFFGFFFTTVVVPAWGMLGYWFLLQLLGGLPTLGGTGAGVAFWAHIGGFVAGIALIRAFQKPARVAAHRAQVARYWHR